MPSIAPTMVRKGWWYGRCWLEMRDVMWLLVWNIWWWWWWCSRSLFLFYDVIHIFFMIYTYYLWYTHILFMIYTYIYHHYIYIYLYIFNSYSSFILISENSYKDSSKRRVILLTGDRVGTVVVWSVAGKVWWLWL